MKKTDGSQDVLWETVFRKSDNIVSRRITDEMFLIPIRGKLADMQRIFTLDPVAEFIWQDMDGTRRMKDIRDRLLDLFDVGRETADSDIREFIEELLEAELIRRAEAT